MNEVAANSLEDPPVPGSASARPPGTPDSVPAAKPSRFPRMPRQLRDWLRVLHHDPTAEERATDERRARLLDELNRAVSDAPDDMPLRDVIARVNNPYSD
ncbi:MAG: hypothetical protein H8F28_08200 [Fibrella sp.]|nr:hypothetical protein [Armatimonadota bacterium]